MLVKFNFHFSAKFWKCSHTKSTLVEHIYILQFKINRKVLNNISLDNNLYFFDRIKCLTVIHSNLIPVFLRMRWIMTATVPIKRMTRISRMMEAMLLIIFLFAVKFLYENWLSFIHENLSMKIGWVMAFCLNVGPDIS